MRLIDADALMIQLENRQAFLVKEWGHRDQYARGFVEAADKVGNAPSVDAVEVKHGLWISYLDGEHIMPDVYFKCNRCGSRGHRLRWHYCPNCGAKMDLE